MICPKCGFSQPDDLYCALCGVHVGKYLQRKKKKRLKIMMAMLALTGGMAVLGVYFWGLPGRALDERTVDQKGKVVAPLSQTAFNSQASQQTLATSQRHEGNSPEEDQTFTPPSPLPRDSQNKKNAQEETTVTLSAEDWFLKGMALDDDSDGEIDFYEKAIALDPTFAPAFFRLGAIYHRQARYENADEAFGQFLEHATEEDKELYDIYVYYSLSDVDRLMERLRLETAASEEEGGAKTESGETQEALTEDETEDSGEETSEEVMTIVHYAPANGHVTVPVRLNNEITTHMLVDTGAGITVVSNDLADELGLTWGNHRSITLKTMAMDVQAQVVSLESIQVGRLIQHDFPVAVANLPIAQDGAFSAILGMDFLRNFTMQIDNKNHTLTLTAKTP